jgi:predicted flap endonuclease-1-like 5' DNA nuclease
VIEGSNGESMVADQVVLAFFKDEDAADDAVEALKSWDKSDKDVKLTSIGVLVLDDKGQLKTHKMGSRSAMKGAGIGLVAAVIFPPSLLAGIVGGGVLGALHHKNVGLGTDDRNRIAAELAGGKAAVGATVKKGDATAVSAKLAELGGVAEVHEVTEEAVAEVAAVAPEVEAAEVAAGDDLTVIDGIGPDYSSSLRAAGVTTFAQLAAMTPEAIADLLAKANTPLIAGKTADTWPRQAKLAADQDWSGLRRYVNSKK